METLNTMKKRMLISILAVVAAAIVVFLIAASRQPDTFRVARSATISAPPSVVFDQVDNFHNWQRWSPFVEYDPNMTITYSGPESGVGASMAWSGNSKAGQGKMTIAECHPGELIRINLEFTKPFAASNIAEFTFQPQGNETSTTWSMVGANPFMFKMMHLVMNMDKMVGNDFSRGLGKLKTISESGTTH